MSEYYTTLANVTEQLMKKAPATDTNEGANYASYVTNQLIADVSQYIHNVTHRFFVPLYEVRNYYNQAMLSDQAMADHGYAYDAWISRLYIDRDLLEGTYTTTGVLLPTAEYRFVGDPVYAIDIDCTSETADFDRSAFSNSQDIAGFWGYHRDWTNGAFTAIEDITLTASATEIAVAAGALYSYPQYVRCEDEIMLITSAPEALKLTVKRGVQGTTAVEHTDKSLSIYNIDDSIELAATRMCAWLYQNKDAQNGIIALGTTSIVMDALPVVVKDTLKALTRRSAV